MPNSFLPLDFDNFLRENRLSVICVQVQQLYILSHLLLENMEATVELPDTASTENVKISEVAYETSFPDDLNLKPNGVSESDDVDESQLDNVNLPSGKFDGNGVTTTSDVVAENDAIECNIDSGRKSIAADSESAETTSAAVVSADANIQEHEDLITTIKVDQEQIDVLPAVTSDSVDMQTKNSHLNDIQTYAEELSETPIPDAAGGDNVRFETEVVVESNDMEITAVPPNDKNPQVAHNILNEMNQNIELSEALRSSDMTDNVENNNCSIRQEVFNKEELLDILEGNDDQVAGLLQTGRIDTKIKETKLALDQITRLKKSRRPRVKKVVETPKEVSIVKALVKDWEDDPEEGDSLIEKDSVNTESDQFSESTASTVKVEKRSSVDSTASDGQNSSVNKSVDDGQPQRRQGRVIKKKVIFDPDNPDTFTKGKTYVKSRESQTDKDQPPSKKGKIEPSVQRANSKSPVSKMQWKKPSSKNSKQNKRLTEVDKLLMDEGAVNMIYQLTPEAPKGKKNMRTKAEFIKRIQSSTPETKEMKFRERKKEGKADEGEAKKILGGKQRPSLSSSVKSPSVCEDFENHSADDSIIYRRHSSSSYSSSCMSPRRLSDVEAGIHHTVNSSLQSNETMTPFVIKPETGLEVLLQDSQTTPGKEIINKDDCLSIKKKLNSKLSLALNKRKKDSSKADKSLKKQMKSNELEIQNKEDQFRFVYIKVHQWVGEIHINNTKTKLSIQMMKEIIAALSALSVRSDTSVTLLTSANGITCSELDLSPALHNHPEERTKAASEIAETIRSLLCAASQHSKLLCVATQGPCAGVGLALTALADVALAAEGATFAPVLHPTSPRSFNVAALVTSYRQLPHSLINDLVIFGRRLSATEALQAGLVSRVLCSPGFTDQVHAIIKEIASEPVEIILMKKKLLNLKKMSDEAFLSAMGTEKSSMVKYWTSDEGQEAIRTAVLTELKL